MANFTVPSRGARPSRPSRRRGMTLIEILIALVVMVLGVLGILALFPPALQSASESVEETNAAILGESVAHSLMTAFQSAVDNPNSPTLQLRCTMIHDMKSGSAVGRYTFILPPLPANPMVNPEWWHFPSSKSPGGQGGTAPTGDSGAKLVSSGWEPDTDDRHFQLGGDLYVQNSVTSVQTMNDPTDPLTQFGFSFDIRKLDDMWYQRRNAGAIDPYRKRPLKLDEYEALEKLYEVRIHILRIVREGAAGGGVGAESRRYITTLVKRISVR